MPLDEDGLQPQAFEEALVRLRAQGRTVKFLYTVPAYHNPAGVTLSEPRREEILAIAERAGRIYVDYNQNLAARNTIAPYSMRGRERPTVATPLTWDEVGAVTGPDDLRFSPEDVLARVEEHGDLASDLLDEDRPPLPEPAD